MQIYLELCFVSMNDININSIINQLTEKFFGSILWLDKN